ncbi:hypothetical protein AB0N88_18080 [Streptomyces sp. NPDC093516]|uniref:hypothetical protein n=1 Tax=Streptomyces sp. NPDC093516 TaxID=3155304 RepID=UPI0034307F10
MGEPVAVGGLMAQHYDSGALFTIAAGIGIVSGVIAAAVGIPAHRARDRHPAGLRHPHTRPDVVALTDRGFGIVN